mmetsp:Transcript_20650/g.47704  ORF Transcript_20650/g.47704 Transcript_20650/m.47704 type:complete len:205 (-) Transcript_20650:105-719(-)
MVGHIGIQGRFHGSMVGRHRGAQTGFIEIRWSRGKSSLISRRGGRFLYRFLHFLYLGRIGVHEFQFHSLELRMRIGRVRSSATRITCIIRDVERIITILQIMFRNADGSLTSRRRMTELSGHGRIVVADGNLGRWIGNLMHLVDITWVEGNPPMKHLVTFFSKLLLDVIPQLIEALPWHHGFGGRFLGGLDERRLFGRNGTRSL